MNRRLFPRRAARAILFGLVFAAASGAAVRAARPQYPVATSAGTAAAARPEMIAERTATLAVDMAPALKS